ncbi:MAG: hypothetical protein RBG13Loki_2901 [Promethearchaeota archaeon CR_4]|nr:MAG: hypothetical protein RBG13Loki_2901 [Candidatus Lokiarchaeota archaeon CR_4]
MPIFAKYSVARFDPQKKSLTPQRWDYYKQVWGFDPVSDCIQLKKGWLRYEVWFPLEHDPDFHAIGVGIGARVDWKGEKISNAIIFRCQAKEARVECTHTVIYHGPKEEVLDLANDPLSVSVDTFPLSPACLPPEEHFVALKSYVAGIAEIGIAQVFRASYLSSEYEPESAVVGFNSLMQKQVAGALHEVAAVPAKVFLQRFLLDLITSAPPAWVEQRLAYLDVTYNISDLIFHDEEVFTHLKRQFPTLPWDEWAAIVKIKWNELKEWADWFAQIETIQSKRGPPFGLPAIGVDYPKFARVIRESSLEELVDNFSVDPTFADTCCKIYHVVIEEENWGGASVRNLRKIRNLIIEGLTCIYSFLVSLLIWGSNMLALFLGIIICLSFIIVFEFLRKPYNKNQSAKNETRSNSDGQTRN